MDASHNNKAGANLVFCVETTARALDCEADVARWLATIVKLLSFRLPCGAAGSI